MIKLNPSLLALLWTFLPAHLSTGCGKLTPPASRSDPRDAGGVGGDTGTGQAPPVDAGGGPSVPPPPLPPPPPPPPPPEPERVRSSLRPVYQLLPRTEYGRIAKDGVQASDADFTTNNIVVSVQQKMDEIAATHGFSTALIPDASDRQRSTGIPFRGNPSDVKFVNVAGQTKIYVPLGGDVMTPGNEVAVVVNGVVRTRIKVGLRPLRLAVHPAGLIFVCNQYSNYVSIIDPTTDQLLTRGGQPVEIETNFYCSDLAFIAENPRVQDADRQFLYVANRWRHSVLKYSADVVRDRISERVVDLDSRALKEIPGAGASPWRLAASEQLNALFVASNKGGEVARIELASDTVSARIAIGAPSVDVVNIADVLYVPTTMIDRGLLAVDDQHPVQVLAPPVLMTGLDGQRHQVHPGAMFDGSRSYNFEDVRNGLMQLNFQLTNTPRTYYTDDVSSEPNYVAPQKVLAGALPTTIIRNRAGTQIFLAMGGSRLVQQLLVDTNARPFTVRPGRIFETQDRPYGLALNEDTGRLYVTNWGSETLQVFDADRGGPPIQTIDLGYAQPAYPATNLERGEKFFYDAGWSNNRRKACATCHFDELDTDGVGFSNGASAPTTFHQVKPNHNLLTTNSYFWNGSFGDGSYASVAFAAQTRGNCELIQLGLIEGPGSDPAGRLGDPNNVFSSNQVAACRPISAGLGLLENQDEINAVIAQEKAIATAAIEGATGLARAELSRVIDFYSVAELRLPPNPLRQQLQKRQLAPSVIREIEEGAGLFRTAGCAQCHDPDNTRHPYTDGRNHGSGADWTQRFVDTYQRDPRVLDVIGAFPQRTLDGIVASFPDREVNVYLDAIESFTPFCFDVTNCLAFEDPLAVRGNRAEESRRLDLIVRVNLADPERQFIPGNVRGAPQINTPSLRGVWTQANLLRHGLARTIREAILGPGHVALEPGESGFAIDALGELDVHGVTSGMSPAEVASLVRFVESIE